MGIKVSYIVLSFNRRKSLERTLAHNLGNSGWPLHLTELVIVDNGSEKENIQPVVDRFKPDIFIQNKRNTGIYRGWNAGMALSTGKYLVLIDCDFLMPDHWLKSFVTAAEAIPQTGVINLFHRDDHLPHISRESKMQPPEEINGITIRQAIPAGVKFMSRGFLMEAGYWRECFGLYGYGDLEYISRLSKTATEHGLINYTLPNLPFALHLPVDDFEHKHLNAKDYENFKVKSREGKPELRMLCKKLGHPRYNPFNCIEPNLFDEVRK